MSFSPDALAGRTVLVTGASSGLGQATARAVVACGARVGLMARDAERLAATLASLPGSGHSLHAVETLGDCDTASSAVATAAAALGGLDGVFHAAGSELILPTRLVKARHVEGVFGAAVDGAIGVAKAAAKAGVLRDGGSLVFMSSAAAARGRPGMAVYGAAKAAVEGLVRSLAVEFAPRAVRVNAIAAGGVVTPMHDRLTRGLPEAAIADYERAHPLGFGAPEDVAGAAAFLLSPASRWITGTVLAVDGGYAVA